MRLRVNLSEQTDLPETKGVVDVFGIGFISQGCNEIS